MLKIVHNLIKNHYHRSGKPYKGVFQLRYGPVLIVKYAYDQNPIEIDLKGVHNIKTYWGENIHEPCCEKNTHNNLREALERNLGGYGDKLFDYAVHTVKPIQEAQTKRARRVFSSPEETEEHRRSTLENATIKSGVQDLLRSAREYYDTYYNYDNMSVYYTARQKDLDTVSPRISYAEAAFFAKVAHAIFLISPETYIAFDMNPRGLTSEDEVYMSREVRENINYHVRNELYMENFRANRWRAGDSWDYPIKDLGIEPVPQSQNCALVEIKHSP